MELVCVRSLMDVGLDTPKVKDTGVSRFTQPPRKVTVSRVRFRLGSPFVRILLRGPQNYLDSTSLNAIG